MTHQSFEPEDIQKEIADRAWNDKSFIAFHGTSADIYGELMPPAQGAHENCALGVHLTTQISVASDYAGNHARATGRWGSAYVYVVEVSRSGEIASCDSRDQYIHMKQSDIEDLKADHPDVSIICADDIGDDLVGAMIVLNPEDVRILGRIDLETAEYLETAEPWGWLPVTAHMQSDPEDEYEFF